MRLRGRGIPVGTLCAIVVLGLASGAPAATLGQVDDFQDGTTQGWRTGAANQNPPSWVADGGPDGGGDGFLLIEGNGQDGAGGNLVAFNTAQWSGSYTAAGVPAIRADLRNLGQSDLVIRLLVEGPGGAFLSSAAASLPAGGSWTAAVWPLSAALPDGAVDVDATLAGVTKLRILHAPDAAGAVPIEGVLGVDNVTALSGDLCLDAGLDGGNLALCRYYCDASKCAEERRGRACERKGELLEYRTGLEPPCKLDRDADYVQDDLDNCPVDFNTDQSDLDGDGVGDVCDNCPVDSNPGQEDQFGDVDVGDVCECPCFGFEDALEIATNPTCEPICVRVRPTALDLTALQCAVDQTVPSAVVEEFTDFGGEALCQLNLRPPHDSLLVLGLGESQVEACRANVLEAAAEAGLVCQ
jgi:hypothetical protein